jgi:hypothetical protein
MGRSGTIRAHLGSLVASVTLAVFLVALLFAFTDLDVPAVGRLLAAVRPETFVAVAMLMAFNSFLACEKWRLIALRIDHDDSPGMPRLLYFAFTSIGVALGQIMPASLCLVASRSIGAHLYGGRALVRGTGATMFDYFFDVLVAGGIALSSILVLIAGGGAVAWLLCTFAIGLGGFLLYGGGTRVMARATRAWENGDGGWRRELGLGIAHSPLFAPEIGRLLLAISALRFAVIVLISEITARAVGLDAPIWQLAAALPFGVIANTLALTPGGLGLNEWAVSSALFSLGGSFQLSVQWALTTRVLVAGGAALGGIAGCLIVVVGTARGSRGRGAE